MNCGDDFGGHQHAALSAFEELSEARAADDQEVLNELVQSAAVLVQWAQAVLGSRGPQQTGATQQTGER